MKYFLESHSSQTLMFIGFLIDSGLIECLKMDRMLVTSCCVTECLTFKT